MATVTLYATCPRCHRRNPAGLAERAADRRRTRMIGSATSFAFAIATWFLPWLAFVLLAVLALVMVVSVYAASRAKSLSWRTVAPNAAFAGVMIAMLYFYPRGAALWPLVLGVRFAIASPDERPWIDATSTLRFELPYR